jgi:ubiquinone/menaquinone biosynthesis C-methylase UbiE
MLMFGAAKVWWVILAEVGPLGMVSRQADEWIRYFVLEALDELGLFEYLEQPHSYGQVVARFGFVDMAFTRGVFETLASGRNSVLIEEDGRYQRNPKVQLPTLEELGRRTKTSFQNMAFFRDFAQQIPARMRQEPVDFVRHFEEEGPAVLSFDRSLSTRIYSGLRKAAFAYVDVEELRGKRILDLGCGSGHETADIWLRLKGEAQITAVDPVRGLLDLAEEQFVEIVSKGNHRTPALTQENRPSFHLMSAMNLDFPDESFDVVYHSLILHWLSSPHRGVQEIARVLKPGGLVFGTQYTRPRASPWQNLMFTVHEGVNGVFWEEEFRQWYEKEGVTLSVTSPAGVFKGRKIGG